MFRQVLLVLACVFMLLGQGQTSPVLAKTKKVKYAKSEVDKAVGKCVGAVLLGGLAGGLLGGKKDRAEGVAIGVGAGGIVCALIMANAKKKDRIIAAQMAAAEARKGQFRDQFVDDNGQPVVLTATAGPAQIIAAEQLQPVRYKASSGELIESPIPDTNGMECRPVDVRISYSSGDAVSVPSQQVCRTAAGNYLYSHSKS